MGTVLYRITTGKHPFKSDNPAATIRNILSDGTTLPSQLVPDYPHAARAGRAQGPGARSEGAIRLGARDDGSAGDGLPPAELAPGERETEPLVRRLFESRIAERAMAMNAAIRRADGDLAALELTDPRYPMSHPSMRAVAMRTSEGMLASSDGALRTAMTDSGRATARPAGALPPNDRASSSSRFIPSRSDRVGRRSSRWRRGSSCRSRSRPFACGGRRARRRSWCTRPRAAPPTGTAERFADRRHRWPPSQRRRPRLPPRRRCRGEREDASARPSARLPARRSRPPEKPAAAGEAGT